MIAFLFQLATNPTLEQEFINGTAAMRQERMQGARLNETEMAAVIANYDKVSLYQLVEEESGGEVHIQGGYHYQ
ncbi:MAG: hypothetical protein JO359_09440 [Candidatus Eremiobacteraeota bacterium]|nr:hypothetical protein [Candidatus Eremiobacteraeota bacterium]